MKKDKKTVKILIFSAAAGLMIHSMPVFAQDVDTGVDKTMDNQEDIPVDNSQTEAIKRGEAVHMVVAAFELEKRQRSFLKDCLTHLPECFFAFSARSDYDEIRFEPLILYPDVFPAYRYYRDINLASMLGLVQGHLTFEQTPFKPEMPVTRVQALKIVLGAADLISWKEKFELSNSDMEPKLIAALESYTHEGAWWYARYVNFALEAGILSENEYNLPDGEITRAELEKMIEKTRSYQNKLGANITE